MSYTKPVLRKEMKLVLLIIMVGNTQFKQFDSPTITGRIIAISAEVENSPDIPLRQYDKVLFNPKGAIPVDFEGDNRLFVVEVENVVAVFRKS